MRYQWGRCSATAASAAERPARAPSTGSLVSSSPATTSTRPPCRSGTMLNGVGPGPRPATGVRRCGPVFRYLGQHPRRLVRRAGSTVVAGERADQVSRCWPRGGDVQAALAAVAGSSGPTGTASVRCVADGQDDRVPLPWIASVLDEGRVRSRRRRRTLDALTDGLQRRAQDQVDPLRCLARARSRPGTHAGGPGVLEHQLDHLVHLAATEVSWPGRASGSPRRAAGRSSRSTPGRWSARRRRCAHWRRPPAVVPVCVCQFSGRSQQRPERVKDRLEASTKRDRLLVISESASMNCRKKLVGAAGVVPGHHTGAP